MTPCHYVDKYNNCTSKVCPFAHSDEELLTHNYRYKSTWCNNMKRTGNCQTKNCPYAHDDKELTKWSKLRLQHDNR